MRYPVARGMPENWDPGEPKSVPAATPPAAAPGLAWPAFPSRRAAVCLYFRPRGALPGRRSVLSGGSFGPLGDDRPGGLPRRLGSALASPAPPPSAAAAGLVAALVPLLVRAAALAFDVAVAASLVPGLPAPPIAIPIAPPQVPRPGSVLDRLQHRGPRPRRLLVQLDAEVVRPRLDVVSLVHRHDARTQRPRVGLAVVLARAHDVGGHRGPDGDGPH